MIKKTINFDIYIKTSEQTLTHSYTAKQKVMSNDKDSTQITFKLLDVAPEELSGSSASILLYMQDGSFFQSSDVTIDRNSVIYTMKEEETKHSGNTNVQIVLKKGTVQTASLIYNFEIEEGLEKYPITEVMIQDWTTLTEKAKAFVEQIEGFNLEQSEGERKADKVVINNLVENGDFSDGLNGWFYQNIDAEVVDGKVKATITDTDIAPTTSYFGQIGINLYKDHEYYLRFEMEPTKETLTNVYVNTNWTEFMRLPVNELSVYSGTVLSDSTKVTDSSNFRINHRPNMNYVIGDTYTIDNVMMIDLTETFGAGNEPTKEEMDELIKVTGYIDGEYALNNKEMLIWTLALIRRNKNAIVALGGA